MYKHFSGADQHEVGRVDAFRRRGFQRFFTIQTHILCVLNEIFWIVCSFSLVLSSPGIGSGPAACTAAERGDLGCLPPFFPKSMLAPGAAPQPRRIFRRIGYWRVPTDQGESIERTSRVGGAIFGARGLPKIAQEPSGRMATPRSINRSPRAS